ERLDYLITYGDLAYYIYNNAKDFYPEDHVFHFSEKEEMMEKLKELIIPGTLVLVKASRALHLETVVEELRDLD
ncbi:MAG: UDP-N-acetylmuramoyl-tripeptide--D-alanyl-D-alanine ligase, partial [Gallicola sp.]|nr:UDP-N-acetylmuramoyl-tripeptide--D-alanyl-D-alanine ligase [Gallicola sp.]